MSIIRFVSSPRSLISAAATMCVLGAGVAFAAEQSGQSSQSTQSQSSQSQSAQSQQGGQSAQLKGQDREFFNKAAQGGMMEVEAAKMAMERASAADVKRFAETLHRDHSAANQKLLQIGQQKGMEAPKQLDAQHRKELDKLAKLKGEEFDKAFLKRAGMQDHKKDIQMFERQAKEGKDPELKAFAEQTLPTLRNHLQMAQSIADGAPTAQSGTPGGAAGGQGQSGAQGGAAGAQGQSDSQHRQQ